MLLTRDCAHGDTQAFELRPQSSADAGVPSHIGVILDGNRRWARAAQAELATGYARGGEQVCRFLRWCEEAGIKYVTLWALSADNLRRRNEEITPILQTIVSTLEELAADGRWRIRVIGSAELLEPATKACLEQVVAQTERLPGPIVNIAVAYDGRREIVDAVRRLLAAETGHQGASIGLTEKLIAQNLYTHGQPDPELIIRTSGEQRLSGFLTWQCAYSEFYFCKVPWPAFTKADFNRALASFAARNRRFGR